MKYRALVLAMAALAALPRPALAQYFGQNKVQYEHFDYKVLKTEHFDIYFYPEERAAVDDAAALAEEWRAHLGRVLEHELSGRQPLVLYASQTHFGQTQVIEGLIGEGTGGVTEYLKRRMVLPFGSTPAETRHVLGHEMVHAFQYDMGKQNALGLPLWFIEGMAEYLSIGPDDAQTAMWLRDAASQPKIPKLTELNNPKYFPYRYGHAVWAYLASRFGERVVGDAYVAAAKSGDAITGIEVATGHKIDELSDGWRDAIAKRYATASPGLPGRALFINEEKPDDDTFDLAPAISPDGKWLAYFSARGLFSIDLYLADPASGRVVRRLTKTDTDTHYESLQFVASSGAWDHSSRQFAFVGVSGGRPIMSVATVDGNDVREFKLTDVDEAMHTTWSPDGKSIAFSGIAGGMTDLFVLNTDTGAVRRLTNDGFADLQPSWAPSGGRIAFVTDRFSSAADRIAFGEVRLATIDAVSGAIEPLPAIDHSKHIDPQWDAKGGSLYLVANPDGVSNIYRLDLATRQFTRLTDVASGVSGVTELSPALSFASAANELAFSVFRHGGYHIRVLDAAEARPVTRTASARSSLLFIDERSVTARRPATSLSPVQGNPPAYPEESYKPKLTLDYAGATGAIGASSQFGAVAAGGVGMQWSDLLGRHTLAAAIQANGGVRDIGGQLTYLNHESRWNWGGTALVFPYVSGAFTESIERVNNADVIVQEQQLFRETDAEARAIAIYPFSRALRFELQGGGRRIWFGREVDTRVFAFPTGEFLGNQRENLDAPASLNLGDAVAALAFDQTVYGPTSPIEGQRYRFEVSPTVGSLHFTNLLLDFRRYMPVVRPFTFAVRGMHFARYGADAEDPRLPPLFIGYPSLVHGYDSGSFDVNECGAVEGACPAFDNLIGSRMLIGNAELRFPLMGAFNGQYHYGPIPIEGFLFADTGAAWTSSESLRIGSGAGPRSFSSSVGAGARINAFGYFVFEMSAARPLNRPGRGWVFGFNLMPGF